MATKTIKLGDIEIPIKENADLVSFQRENFAYLPDGVSINNESSLKLEYDPLSNTIDIGSIKSVLKDGHGNPIGDPETFSGKIKLWSVGDADASSPESIAINLETHTKDTSVHMDIEDRRSLTSISGFFDLMTIGYSDEGEETVFGPIENGSEIYAYRSFYLEPKSDIEFNTVKIKIPQTSQDSVEKVYAMIYIITGDDSYSETGRIMGYSSNGVHVYSTNSSNGYFEWNFPSTILVYKNEEMVIKFFTKAANGQETNYLIKSKIKHLENYEDPTCYLKSDSENKMYYSPECVFTKKKPNSLFFK